MEKEILACIDNNNLKYLQSGQISKYIFPVSRKEAHQKNITHLIVRFFIMAITPENEFLYLVQKRGKTKESYPKYYTDSASGHVEYEKNLNLNKIKKNATRELEEEFGIPRKGIQKIIFYDLDEEKDNFTSEIAFIFLGLVNYNIKLDPNPKELESDGSKFYTKLQLEKLLETQKSVDYSKEIWKELIKTDIKDLFETEKDSQSNKKEKVALFIGRFQPLHHGHIYVIRNILKSFHTLKIGIGSSQLSNVKNDPFTNDERKQFINAALKKREIPTKKYKIYNIPDIYNAKKWCDHVISIVGEFDVVFSNSSFIRQLFQNKGIKGGRRLVIFKNKFNATNIRNLIAKDDKNWLKLVPKEVYNLIQKFNGVERIKSLNK
ncbi:MAG: nicotinamide-nucleotide adenylyltransferase [Candidatus Hodarchaeota archaeon]